MEKSYSFSSGIYLVGLFGKNCRIGPWFESRFEQEFEQFDRGHTLSRVLHVAHVYGFSHHDLLGDSGCMASKTMDLHQGRCILYFTRYCFETLDTVKSFSEDFVYCISLLWRSLYDLYFMSSLNNWLSLRRPLPCCRRYPFKANCNNPRVGWVVDMINVAIYINSSTVLVK